MAMERVSSSIVAAALLFLTLVVLAAAASGGGDDDAAAAVEEEEEEDPLANEPYMLVTFRNKAGGEEIKMLADKGTETLSASGFANRSGHWFYTARDGKGGSKRRRLPLAQLSSNDDRRSRAEGLWDTLAVLANTSDNPAAADDGGEQGYMLVGMQTSGGDKIRLVVVVADQRHFFITGFAKGWFIAPRWSFRDGERHRLDTALAGKGGSHAEVVASNVLAAMVNGGRDMA